jgi:CRP/FNR family transcriptional regulator
MTANRAYPRDLAQQLLTGVSPDARQSIVAASHPRTLRAGQVLFRTGERAEELFVLRRGRLKFSRLASTGREIVLGILVPGDVFGLGTILTRPVDYIGTAESLESGEALVWSRKALQALTVGHPQLAENVLYVALRYVAVFAERHESLVTVTAEQRLARALTRLGVQDGTRTQLGIEVRIKNEQLASLADVSPFTASRLLKGWERDGVITKRRGIVHIICPERLLVA